MKSQIVPTILVNNQEAWDNKVRKMRGLFPRIQVDIIDGRFAENQTIELEQLRGIEDFVLDIHLMVKQPILWVERCRKTGASLVIGQIEMMEDQQKFIEMVKMGNMGVGLGLDLETRLESIDKAVVPQIDHLLLMSVKAGFSGQKLLTDVLQKIKSARSLAGGEIEIGVDGGINETNLRQIGEAGADVLYVGSALEKVPDLQVQLRQLKKLIE